MKNLSLTALTIVLSSVAFSTSGETVSGQSQAYDSNGVEVNVGKTQFAQGTHSGVIGDPDRKSVV